MNPQEEQHFDEEQGRHQAVNKVTGFTVQANALMRKNITFQRRSWKTNACLVTFPLLLCILLLVMQLVINNLLNGPKFSCGCRCVPEGSPNCEKICGLQYSTSTQAVTCAVPSPPEIPAFMQVPHPEFRATEDSQEYSGFPNPSCRHSKTCALSFVYTAQNRSFADTLMSNILHEDSALNSTDPIDLLSNFVPGTPAETSDTLFIESALTEKFYILRPNCSTFNNSLGVPCASTEMVWRDNTSIINSNVYHGYKTKAGILHEIPVVYDFHDTSPQKLHVTVYYNATLRNDTHTGPHAVLRVARSMNLASQAFLTTVLGPNYRSPLMYVKEMPKPKTQIRLDFSSLLGPLFSVWVVQLLLPIILTSLVYEKQKNLRIMMKMHGLGDGAYWLITYGYFLALSIFYIACFVLFGSAIGLKFFRLNDYSIQFVFFFIFVNLQIALAFLAAAFFANVRTATVCGYLYVFGLGLLGAFFFQYFVEDSTTGRGWILAMELIPGFSLYRGLYELSQYSFVADYQGSSGMRWENLNDKENGMRQVFLIMAVEWILFLSLGLYLDQVIVSSSGLRKHPLFFLDHCFPNAKFKLKIPILQRKVSFADTENLKPDILREKSIVEGLREVHDEAYSIICDDLKKVYPSADGNANKYAVRGLSLAVRRGECFGVLGPNGAGKSTSINMMTGFLKPTSGKALIHGLDISKKMDEIFSLMGVCPQHDLLWENLTGREHLLFYGRLKNLKGAALESAVQLSLKSVNLFNGGVGDKQTGTYSGGMKRRLSVAISLIGDPKVVYMDEPSTGLDPASRNNLWNVIRQAKRDRAIILTTHSMEEAEALCDRVGIFVKGQMQCIGNAKELRARYGGCYVFTITTPASKEEDVMKMVDVWSCNARRVYNLSGTQKFEIPKDDVKISVVFNAVEEEKGRLNIQAWGLADTTLEDVFIKVAKDATTLHPDADASLT